MIKENNAIRNWKISTSSNDLTILGVLEATKQSILNNYKIKTTNN